MVIESSKKVSTRNKENKWQTKYSHVHFICLWVSIITYKYNIAYLLAAVSQMYRYNVHVISYKCADLILCVKQCTWSTVFSISAKEASILCHIRKRVSVANLLTGNHFTQLVFHPFTYQGPLVIRHLSLNDPKTRE